MRRRRRRRRLDARHSGSPRLHLARRRCQSGGQRNALGRGHCAQRSDVAATFEGGKKTHGARGAREARCRVEPTAAACFPRAASVSRLCAGAEKTTRTSSCFASAPASRRSLTHSVLPRMAAQLHARRCALDVRACPGDNVLQRGAPLHSHVELESAARSRVAITHSLPFAAAV